MRTYTVRTHYGTITLHNLDIACAYIVAMRQLGFQRFTLTSRWN